MDRLITFGDSWALGSCNDLIEYNLQLHDDNVFEAYNGAVAFKKPWPAILADKLEIPLENKALAGNSNKSIITQLYDQYVFQNYNKNDLVIVSLSTWHRKYRWHDNFKFHLFPESSSRYGHEKPVVLKDGSHYFDNLHKMAYDTFYDFFTIRNFLENLQVKFYIGWAFTYIEDFSPFLNKKYVDVITNTKNLLDPMLKFCKVYPEKLLHPTLDEHKKYGNYLYNRIIQDVTLN